MPGILKFDDDCLIVLRRDLLAVAPLEGCALLLGGERQTSSSERDIKWHVQLIWPCCNVWEPGKFDLPEVSESSYKDLSLSQKNRFALDPREQILAQKWARKRKMKVLGSAHSHPKSGAIHSALDHLYAIPPCLMVILDSGGSFRSWFITGNKSEQKAEVLLVNGQ